MNYSNEQTQKPTARFPRLRLRSWWGPQKTEPRGSTSRYQASARAVWPNLQQLTLPQFQEQMVGLLRGKIAGSTLVLYASSLRVLSRVVGDIPVASLRAYHIELFMARRLEEVSGVRVNIEFRALRAMLNRAASYGMVPENPMAGLRQVRLPRREPRALSRKEFARLLSVINRREFRALAIFAVCTAMRAGEIASLRWQDVEFARGVIHLANREGFRLKGLRGRDVPLNRRAVSVLKELPRRSERVFVNTRGKPYTPHTLSVRFKKYVRLAALPEDIHFHTLRHTGASWMVERKVPLPYIREILGHASITTTMIYAHSTVEHLRQSVRKLDPIISC